MSNSKNHFFWAPGDVKFSGLGIAFFAIVMAASGIKGGGQQGLADNAFIHQAVIILILVSIVLSFTFMLTRNKWKIDGSKGNITEFTLGLFPGKSCHKNEISSINLDKTWGKLVSNKVSFKKTNGDVVNIHRFDAPLDALRIAKDIAMILELPLYENGELITMEEGVKSAPFYMKEDVQPSVNLVSNANIESREKTSDGYIFLAATVPPGQRGAMAGLSAVARKQNFVSFAVTKDTLTITGEDGKEAGFGIDQIEDIQGSNTDSMDACLEIKIGGKLIKITSLQGEQIDPAVSLIKAAIRELRG